MLPRFELLDLSGPLCAFEGANRHAGHPYRLMVASGETRRTHHGPGDAAYLGAGVAKGYRIPDHSWMLEYARGPIPLMLPFGLADTALSTLDVRSFGRTVREYTSHPVRSLLRGKI